MYLYKQLIVVGAIPHPLPLHNSLYVWVHPKSGSKDQCYVGESLRGGEWPQQQYTPPRQLVDSSRIGSVFNTLILISK
jgi:hypothetical protein